MPSHQLDVPALPVLVPLGGVLMILSWVLLRRRGRLSARRLTTAWVAGWYAVAVIGATLLPLRLHWGPDAGPPELFRIIFVPVSTLRPIDFVLNVIMTLPLAALLYLVAGLRERRRVVLVGFLTSLVIEIVQAVLVVAWHGTRWADINDLVANTVGTLIGFLAFRRAMRSPDVRRLVHGWSLAATTAAPVQRPVTRS
jgi:glycopeptide antibiotics resistance protein